MFRSKVYVGQNGGSFEVSWSEHRKAFFQGENFSNYWKHLSERTHESLESIILVPNRGSHSFLIINQIVVGCAMT